MCGKGRVQYSAERDRDREEKVGLSRGHKYRYA